MKVYFPRTAGPCAKAHVVATLITKKGERYESSNFCLTPQQECPREIQGYRAGEGYHLCKTICNQVGHAKENVLFFAKKNKADVRGSTIYVDYSWICNNCKKLGEDVGVNIVVGKPPEDNPSLKEDDCAVIVNQCDGCCSGADLRGNLHIDRYGKAFMVCEKHKYMERRDEL